MLLNLHHSSRGHINLVNKDEDISLYKSIGQVNTKGQLRPKYAPAEKIKAQIQAEKDSALYHADRVGQNDTTRKAYIYADSSLPPAGVVRPFARGGDIIIRADGTTWLVIAVLKDFSAQGWVSVRIALQTKEADFSGSDWWVDENEK